MFRPANTEVGAVSVYVEGEQMRSVLLLSCKAECAALAIPLVSQPFFYRALGGRDKASWMCLCQRRCRRRWAAFRDNVCIYLGKPFSFVMSIWACTSRNV